MEVKVGNAARPVGVDVRHVHPRRKRARERVQQPFFGLVDFGNAQDVVDVVDNGQTGRGNEVGGCVSRVRAVGVDVQALDLGGGVAGSEALAVDGNKTVEVTFVGCGDGEFDDLVAALGCGRSTSTLFTRGARCRGWTEAECHILVLLLQHVDLGRQVSGLRSLRRWE